MPNMLSVSIETKSRGNFCGYVQALAYQKNSKGLLSVHMYGVPDSVVLDRECSDVTCLLIDGNAIYPEAV